MHSADTISILKLYNDQIFDVYLSDLQMLNSET